ncbi:uncharacterized protein H6S33_002322 [Morchella sextelata]|uniref:uncharacterized protein n=1 Tax=Morchella sextelata TaxID=1174677 RepID=UPI001D04FC83|nr:uncharacterized protein H6S33_002322 [Morchella sextelata]KAH0608270.1 hypothetical protein H6S33_002322 [Morchella sextelata]
MKLPTEKIQAINWRLRERFWWQVLGSGTYVLVHMCICIACIGSKPTRHKHRRTGNIGTYFLCGRADMILGKVLSFEKRKRIGNTASGIYA